MVGNSEFKKARIEQEAADTVRYRIQFRRKDIGRKEVDLLVSLFTNGKLEYKNCIELINRSKLDDDMFNKLLSLAQDKKTELKVENIDEKLQVPNMELPQEETKKENQLNLENVSDFTKDGKDYIKMRYSDGSIKIIENSIGKSGKEIFEYLQSRYNINSSDGINNATMIFENLIKSYHEVKLTNVKNMTKEEYNNLNLKEKELFNIIRRKYVGYEIIASPEENIYVISLPGKDEKVVSVEERNGMYVIEEVDEKGYRNNNKTNDNKVENEYVNGNTEVINFDNIYENNENEEYDKAKEDPTYVSKKNKQLVKKLQPPYSKAGYMDAALLALIVGMSGMSLTAIMLHLITK